MGFKDEILASLKEKPDHKSLVEIIRRHKAAGKSQRETYNELEEIWLQFGFDEDDGGGANPLRDELEYALELTWGFCPAGAKIWETSLTNHAAQHLRNESSDFREEPT